MMGQEASTLASEYGPQWMNMPNLACRNHAVRCASASALASCASLMVGIPNRRTHAVRLRRKPHLLTGKIAMPSLLTMSVCFFDLHALPQSSAWEGRILTSRQQSKYKRDEVRNERRFFECGGMSLH